LNTISRNFGLERVRIQRRDNLHAAESNEVHHLSVNNFILTNYTTLIRSSRVPYHLSLNIHPPPTDSLVMQMLERMKIMRKLTHSSESLGWETRVNSVHITYL
jgi:hypothetical protein